MNAQNGKCDLSTGLKMLMRNVVQKYVRYIVWYIGNTRQIEKWCSSVIVHNNLEKDVLTKYSCYSILPTWLAKFPGLEYNKNMLNSIINSLIN